MTTWTPLADFLRDHAPVAPQPHWQHPLGAAAARPSLRAGVEELVDTITALQRAEWLEDGVYVGPRSYDAVYIDLCACAATLGVPPPPAIIRPIPAGSQRVLGTDSRPFLHLSSFFFARAPEAERRFLLGRLLGPIATAGVTSGSVYAMLMDEGGLRTLARRTLGPTVEVGLAPASFAARLLLSRRHRVSEIDADRAGLLCAGDVDAASRALLRINLGVTPQVDPDAYLEQLDRMRDGSPGRWAEALASRPWTHKRIRALHLFADSAAGQRALGQPESGMDDDALNTAIDRLLGVGPWTDS